MRNSIVFLLVCTIISSAQDVLIESTSSDDVLLQVRNTGSEVKTGVDVQDTVDGATGVNVRAGRVGVDIVVPNIPYYTVGLGLQASVNSPGDGWKRSMGVSGTARGENSVETFGVYGDAHAQKSSTVFGVYGVATIDAGGSGDSTHAYGIYGTVGGVSSGNFRAAGYFNGPLWATSALNVVSDEKFKRNVRDLPLGLSKVMALRPRLYEMKTEEYQGRLDLPQGEQIGFVAQELESVLPQLVKQGVAPGPVTSGDGRKGIGEGDIKYKGVDYNGVIPVLVKAIQEQQALIETLNAKVAALERK
jgi:hypothetical protein